MSGRAVLLAVVVKSGLAAEHFVALAAAEFGFRREVVRLQVVGQVLFVVKRLRTNLAQKWTVVVRTVDVSDVSRELVEVGESRLAELTVEAGLVSHLKDENN